jgi:hypothetical protein
MAATVVICEANTGSETAADNIANINFGSTDASALTPASYPITIINAGTAYSYEKYIRLKCSGTYTKVDNLQYWVATTPSTGVTLKTSTTANTVFAAPIVTVSSKATTAVPTADPGTANIGIDGAFAGHFDTSETQYSNYVCAQLSIVDTASPGNMTQLTWTFQYDEQ